MDWRRLALAMGGWGACAGGIACSAGVPGAGTGDAEPGHDDLAGETGDDRPGGGPAGGSTEIGEAMGAHPEPFRFDTLWGDDLGAPFDACAVVDDMNAVGECERSAPPDSFEPAIQWTFGPAEKSWVTPLVGNFTDDDGNGVIDLCDTPDVILVANASVSYGSDCYVHVLDGATGAEHFHIPPREKVSCVATPAFGDIDNDGLPELVTVWNSPDGVFRLKAFEHDGSVKWVNRSDGDEASQFQRQSGAIAIHDLDADGDPEIVFNHEVYDSDGFLRWAQPNPHAGELEASVGVDLDGDGLMEVVTGHAAYRFDGSVYWDNYPTIPSQAIAQIADLDDDPSPEVFVTSGAGLFLVEHDGEIAWGPVTPTGISAGAYLVWQRPGTIHDFDGDGAPELASSSRQYYAVYEPANMAEVLWRSTVSDHSGAAGGTAFDFLGDGVAEAMYADERFMRIYDGLSGEVLLEQARFSATISEYPIVADVDNDGSAEILVVSMNTEPALQVIRDVEDRWIQARRIWNQHAYYVTNVREDSTIPRVPVDNWETLNTFRTNAQIEGGGLCRPEPQG